MSEHSLHSEDANDPERPTGFVTMNGQRYAMPAQNVPLVLATRLRMCGHADQPTLLDPDTAILIADILDGQRACMNGIAEGAIKAMREVLQANQQAAPRPLRNPLLWLVRKLVVRRRP